MCTGLASITDATLSITSICLVFVFFGFINAMPRAHFMDAMPRGEASTWRRQKTTKLKPVNPRNNSGKDKPCPECMRDHKRHLYHTICNPKMRKAAMDKAKAKSQPPVPAQPNHTRKNPCRIWMQRTSVPTARTTCMLGHRCT